MIDNHAAMVDFIRAFDDMRECQKRFFALKASGNRIEAVQAAKMAERKADALRLRVVLPGDEPTTGRLL
jgi:hypothetical protein